MSLEPGAGRQDGEAPAGKGIVGTASAWILLTRPRYSIGWRYGRFFSNDIGRLMFWDGEGRWRLALDLESEKHGIFCYRVKTRLLAHCWVLERSETWRLALVLFRWKTGAVVGAVNRMW